MYMSYQMYKSKPILLLSPWPFQLLKKRVLFARILRFEREKKKKGTDTACDVTALIWGHSDQVTELLSKWRQNRRILRTRFFERWRNSFVHLFTKKVINLYTFSLTAKIKLKHTLPKKRERYKYQIYAISLPWQKCFQINQKKNFY